MLNVIGLRYHLYLSFLFASTHKIGVGSDGTTQPQTAHPKSGKPPGPVRVRERTSRPRGEQHSGVAACPDVNRFGRDLVQSA